MEKTKRPSFQFYPSDWLRDTALRTCSEGARGVWIDLICYMHEGTPYGHLKVNEKIIKIEEISRMLGVRKLSLKRYLFELKNAGVFQQLEDGTIYSPRMVRDEYLREIRGKHGVKGGNPELLKVKDKVNHADNHKSETKVKPNLTPSSSSSSSSSNITNNNISNIYTPEPVLEGCKFFRISIPEQEQVKNWYAKNGFDLNLIPLAVLEVDGWMERGSKQAAIKARKASTHYRQLYASWVIENATKMLRAKKSLIPFNETKNERQWRFFGDTLKTQIGENTNGNSANEQIAYDSGLGAFEVNVPKL